MNNDTPQPTVKESLTVQKPRCPWPVHQWHPQVKSVRVHDQTRLIVYLTTSPFPSYFDFDCSGLYTDTTWTRAEALASQMRPAPDKVGVWAIYREGKLYATDYLEDLQIRGDEYGAPCVEGSEQWFIGGDYRFYYMGPLPTAESEVWHE